MEQKNDAGASVSAIAFDELRVVQTIKSGDARIELGSSRLSCFAVDRERALRTGFTYTCIDSYSGPY